MRNYFWDLWHYYIRHLRLVELPFEAIFYDRNILKDVRNRKYRYHYLFPLSLSLVIALDTGVQFIQNGNTPRSSPIILFLNIEQMNDVHQ